MENKKAVPDFWAKEDWQAIWIGAIVIIIACFAVLTKAFDFSAIKFATWTLGENLSEAAAAKVVPLGEQSSDSSVLNSPSTAISNGHSGLF